MKKVLAAAVLVSCCAMVVFAEKERARGNEGDVIMEEFPVPIPNDIPQANKLIWEFISKRPEQQWFIHYSTKDWRKNCEVFAAALVTKAKKKGLDYEALEKLLKKLPSDQFLQQDSLPERACLPIGAYPVKVGDRKLWMVFCLWEYAVDPGKVVVDPPGQTSSVQEKPKKLDWDKVGHVLAIVYYADGEVFTFVSCD